MDNPKQASNSKTFLGVVIALLLVLGLFDLMYTFTGVYAPFGLLYPAAHGLLNILLFLALSFIWSGERWAAWLFLGIVLAHLGLDLFAGRDEYFKLLLLIPGVYFLLTLRKN